MNNAAMRRARIAAERAKRQPSDWRTCGHCGAHQSQELAPLAICFLCQRSMLEPVRLTEKTGGKE